jgi:hypothetical protein
MNRSTSGTGMKWRATSSITPRQENLGRSTIRTYSGRPVISSWRNVCRA